MNKFKKGFTVVEVIVVIVIIGILVSVVLASLSAAKRKIQLNLLGTQTAYADSGCGGWWEPDCPTTVDNVVTSVPVPQLTSSSERANVAERAKRFDDPKKLSYVYLISYGKVMAFYTAKGKVSSLNSFLIPTEEAHCYGSEGCVTTDAADIDGTYGQNVEGIFFFTTEGAYVEWKGEYMMSDQPLQLSTPPELVREIK